MRSRALYRLVGLMCSIACEAGDTDDGVDFSAVMVLTSKSFNETITKHQYVLVDFYTPWCGNIADSPSIFIKFSSLNSNHFAGHCKKLKPHFARAAQDLKKLFPSVVLANVDVETFPSFSNRFQITGFPTLKWFSNGDFTEYTGGKTDAGIIAWVQKRLRPPAEPLPTPALHDAFLSSADAVVIGYFEDAGSERRGRFLSAARDIDAVAFGHAGGRAVLAHAGREEGAIVLCRRSDGGVQIPYDGEVTTPALQARPDAIARARRRAQIRVLTPAPRRAGVGGRARAGVRDRLPAAG